MRNEIDAIPNDQKTALLNAREKCRPEEFSDARLLLFLRCVGMNAKVSFKDDCCSFLECT